MSQSDAGPVYPIGEMSRRSGVNIETIRYYERIGIMPEPARSAGGQRHYGSGELKRLVFVRQSRRLGFSLNEIRALLKLVDADTLTCAQVHARTIEHLADVRQKLADLRRMEKVLKTMAAECSGGDVPDCPIIDALFADRSIEV